MTKADRKKFDTELVAIAITTREKITGDLLDAYFKALEDLEIASLTAAMQELSKTAKFFPKAGEIRELAKPVVLPYWQIYLDGEPVKQISDTSQKSNIAKGAAPSLRLNGGIEGVGAAKG